MGLGERTFRCERCGVVMDRDRNAAANLAAWAEAVSTTVTQAPDRQAGGRVTTPLERTALTIAVAMVELASVKGEPMPTPS